MLLQREKITAPELAEHFEVSKRTILRDIDALCQAGIPIATTQGTGGGIRIMDGYRMDRTVLTSKDMQMILAGLRSLDSVSGSNYYSRLMEKIKAGSSDFIGGNDTNFRLKSSMRRHSVSIHFTIFEYFPLTLVYNWENSSFSHYLAAITQLLIRPHLQDYL